MNDQDKACIPPEAYQDSTFAKIAKQQKALDDALASIEGYTDESNLTRTFIVGQIEALKWVMRVFSV